MIVWRLKQRVLSKDKGVAEDIEKQYNTRSKISSLESATHDSLTAIHRDQEGHSSVANVGCRLLRGEVQRRDFIAVVCRVPLSPYALFPDPPP